MQQERRRQHAVIEAVERANRFWKRSGVSDGVRQRMRQELCDHLTDATRDGLAAEDVVGPDVAAFAASWARASAARAWIDRSLQVAIVAFASTGVLALVGPLLGEGRTGLTPATIILLLVAGVGVVGGEVLRRLREHLTRSQAVAAAIVGAITAFVLGTVLVDPARPFDVVLPIPPVLVAGLFAAAAGAQIVQWRVRGHRPIPERRPRG